MEEVLHRPIQLPWRLQLHVSPAVRFRAAVLVPLKAVSKRLLPCCLVPVPGVLGLLAGVAVVRARSGRRRRNCRLLKPKKRCGHAS